MARKRWQQKSLPTATQYEYKHEKLTFFLLFYTKREGCFRHPGPLLLLQGWFFFFLFHICVYSACKPCLHYCLCQSLADTGWCWKQSGWDWCTLTNANKSVIHKSTRRYIWSYLQLTPHALHNSLELSYITYMLHSLISYVTDKGKHLNAKCQLLCFFFTFKLVSRIEMGRLKWWLSS